MCNRRKKTQTLENASDKNFESPVKMNTLFYRTTFRPLRRKRPCFQGKGVRGPEGSSNGGCETSKGRKGNRDVVPVRMEKD